MEPMQDSLPTQILKVDPVPRIGVIINPLSGGNRKKRDQLRQTLGDYPRVLQRDVQHPADVVAALEAFADRRVNLIVVSGGDGTVQAVLTALFHHRPFETPPPLMILQAGTASMTALDVGVLGSQRKALQRLFRWCRSGCGSVSTIERPVLRVAVPGHDVHCGMFFGAGGICRAIQYYHRHMHADNLRGLPGICLTMIRFLLAVFHQHSTLMPPIPLTVRLDQRPLQQFEASFVFVSTLERLLLGLFPFGGPKAEP